MNTDESLGGIDFGLLRTFLIIADEGAVSAAAKRMRQSQPNVSMRLKKLEGLVGTPLFERTTRSLKLTIAGEEFSRHAGRLLALGEEMLLAVQGPKEQSVLRIGVADHAVHTRLTAILSGFWKFFPEARLHVETGFNDGLLKRLEEGELDFVICHKVSGYKPSLVLMHEPLVWVLPKSEHLEHRTTLPLALLTPPCQYRESALKALANRKIRSVVIFSSASLSGVLSAVEGELCMSALPLSCVPGSLRALSDDEVLPLLPQVELCLYGDGSGRAHTSFIRAIREYSRSTT